MKLRTINPQQTLIELLMPNGSRLLYINDTLEAAITGDMLCFNFDTGSRRDNTLTKIITEWAEEYKCSSSGERTTSEIVAMALMPATIEFGNYGDREQPTIKATPRRRSP